MTDAQMLVFLRVIFSIPIILSLIQQFLLSCVFPYETPVKLYLNNDHETLKILMNKLYVSDVIDKKMGELERDVKKELEDNSKGKTHDINGDD